MRIVEGRTAGVFVAPELDAIEQVPPGEDPKISCGSPGAATAPQRPGPGALLRKKKKDDGLRRHPLTLQGERRVAVGSLQLWDVLK
eukprot:Skav219183  [mRNA]  locus=scaffold648:553502:555720:- [translate_table: standard]